MANHGGGPSRPPMSNARFYALLVFAFLVLALLLGTISQLLK